ncbi:MAG: acetate--CoA ligase [Solirubrobacterales bacterium]|nr:acetate--CoA ligase [Solirubrobacterales bacterium]OJU95645.1 MAG: acetate--CoA ligase [Solirubrobacterales bacterium 67-14]
MADQSELDVLLKTEQTFPPPEQFAQASEWSDPGIYDRADQDPEAWWAGWAEKLDWIEPWETVLDWTDPPHVAWFAGGKLNVSANCLDRHVAAGRSDKVAYHWEAEDAGPDDRPVTGVGSDAGGRISVTYGWLHDQTQRLANVLKAQGVGKGDVVGIFMPMVPEAAVAMLACTRIGAIHNVVFGGFSAESLRERMEFSEAKALITADATLRRGQPMPMKAAIDQALESLPAMEKVIVFDRCGTEPPMTEGRDLDWASALAAADPACEPEAMDAEDPLFLLYTSGSTAKPKGIVHTTGGYLTQVAATHEMVFDLKDDDVFWCAADIGWVTGHSYIVYGPLANGATSIMFEGAPDFPARDRWWEIVERYEVTILYTAPTVIRSFMKWGEDLPAAHDLSSLRLLGSVGEPINPKAWIWYREHIGGGRCPVVDTWWQTETGAIMISPLPALTTTKPGSATRPLPGLKAAIYDNNGGEIEEGGGTLVLTRPWPAMARTLFKEPDRYVNAYWDRYGKETYLVGDAARRDEDGYFWIVGRIDDVINVSGHRLSTMEIESALVSHPHVAEAAVIGIPDEDTGQAIIAFAIPNDEAPPGSEFTDELREHVAVRIGKLARPKAIYFADDLPKTRSGKIMRRLLRDVADGKELGDVSTLRDPSVVEQLQTQVTGSH